MSEAEELMLDLRAGGTLPAALLRRLDEIAASRGLSFNAMIAALSRGHERDIDWWVCRPVTRNTHRSRLYDQCMQLALVRALLDEGRRVLCLVDAPALASVLAGAGEPALRIVSSARFAAGWRRRLQTVWDIGSSLFHSLGAALAAWLTRGVARAAPAQGLTIIGTFVLPGSIAAAGFHDRYYPGALDLLAPEERSRIAYLPRFVHQRHYLAAFRALRRDRANFLFREDFLGLADYRFAFGHWRRVARLCGASTGFAGFEIGALFAADLAAGRFAASVIDALLTYRFWLAAKRHGLKPRRVIDWYEGQDINHGPAAAINWHWPEIDLIGFRSVGSPLFMSLTPAPHEVAAGIVPRTLAVVGTAAAAEIAAAHPGLSVIPGPGIRYRRAGALGHRSREPGGAILLTLPLLAPLAGSLLRAAEAARRMMPRPPAAWWVKRHPAMPQGQLRAALGGDLPRGFRFVEGDFHDWLTRADVIMGVASSTLVEAVGLGVPSICLASGNRVTEIPIPAWVDRRLWRVAYDAAEAAAVLEEFLSAGTPDVDLGALRLALLGPADDAATRRFFGFDSR